MQKPQDSIYDDHFCVKILKKWITNPKIWGSRRSESYWSLCPGIYVPTRRTGKSERIFLSNASRFSKQHCLLEGSQTMSICPGKGNADIKMSMEQWWNYTERGKPKYSDKSLSQCQLVHQRSHMDWSGIELGPSRWKAGDQSPESWHDRHLRTP